MAIRLGAVLPEHVVTRIKRLLAAAPDQDAAMRFLNGCAWNKPRLSTASATRRPRSSGR